MNIEYIAHFSWYEAPHRRTSWEKKLMASKTEATPCPFMNGIGIYKKFYKSKKKMANYGKI